MTRPQLVFVLQAVQPLTTDPAAAVPWPDCEVVVLAGAAGPPFREDVPPLSHRVRHAPMADWPRTIPRLAAGRPFDVVTNDEYALLACRSLRADLGLPPRHPDGLIGYLDKAVMKQRLSEAGVDTPRYATPDRVVAADGAARRLVAELGLPMVAKPRQEANSRGVDVLATTDEVRDWLRRRDGQSGWHVEEFVTGTQHHVNGVVSDGSVAPVQVGQYLGPLLELPEGRRLGGVILPDDHELVPAAHRLNAAVVAALGTGRFIVHTEFVVRPDGRLTVLEVAARAPGAMVSEAARLHAGLNLETGNLALQLGVPAGEVTPRGIQAAWVWTPVMPGERFHAAPVFDVDSLIHVRRAARRGNTGSSGLLGASVLLWDRDDERLARDVQLAMTWDWTK